MPSINNQQESFTAPKNNVDDVFDVKPIIKVVLQNWYLFLIGFLICSFLGLIYGYYSARDWRVGSKILVEDSKNNPSSLGASSGLGADFSSIFNVKSSADNEVQILKSRNLMETTVNQLQLNVRTYLVNGLKSTEIYQESPFTINIKYKVDTLLARKFKILFQENGSFQFTNDNDDINIAGKIGETIKLKQYDITFSQIAGKKLAGAYAITIESTDATVDALSKEFAVGLSDKQATTIDLGLNYPHSKKGEVILEKLMDLYLLSNLENKVRIADNTMAFIDTRISLVFNELNDVEQKFEQYKTNNNISDISTQSKVLVTSASEYLDKLNQEETQLTIFKGLKLLLNDPKNKKLIPSSMVAPTNLAFGEAINSYNQLLIERDKASLAFTNGNPVVQNFDQQIETARQTLLSSVDSYKNNLEISISELKKQNSSLNSKLQSVPSKERGYLDFQRKQSLKQDLYLYLLQKREETAISKTSTISSSRIIDHAKSEFLPYKPKKAIGVLIGAIIGLIIPGAYLFIKDVLNVKINSRQDIEKITPIAIVGEIGHNDTQDSLVTTVNSRTLISEQFRSMRTKLSYLLNPAKSNVILFTSSMGGEGKSFLSLNLGSALALTGKKIAFMELDLRKPKLSEIMGHDHNVNGYSNYIVSEFADFNKLIKPLWFDENCSLISSGPIPPNPTELLTHQKLRLLIDELKSKFDYVIIDCAPVGLVTDALLLEKYADLTFYVVREGFTYKSQLNIVNDLKRNEEVKNLYLVINDVKSKQEGYSSYGYGLEEKKSLKRKLFF